MSINFYTLTEQEIETINTLNLQRTNVLMIVCCIGNHVGINADDLQKPEFIDYLTALGSYDPNKVVVIEEEQQL